VQIGHPMKKESIFMSALLKKQQPGNCRFAFD